MRPHNAVGKLRNEYRQPSRATLKSCGGKFPLSKCAPMGLAMGCSGGWATASSAACLRTWKHYRASAPVAPSRSKYDAKN